MLRRLRRAGDPRAAQRARRFFKPQESVRFFCLDTAAGDFAQAMLGDQEDLMHKCTGWLLREAGRPDRPRLERFLRAHGPAIHRTSVRYAIERFPEARRKRILRDTRGDGG